MNSVINRFGGKGNMIKQILSYFPETGSYMTFIDAFGGAGTVLLKKPKVPVEIFNDLDDNIYALFHVLQDDELFARFLKKAELSYFHERVSREYRADLRTLPEMSVEDRAFKFWYVNRTRRPSGSVGGSGLFTSTLVRRNMTKNVSDFLSSIDGLLPFHERLQSIMILHRDAVKLIKKWDKEKVLIYLDPPYVQSTRSEHRYDMDFSDDDHIRLLDTIKELRHAKVVLSGYSNPIYDNSLLEAEGWESYQFVKHTQDGNNKKKDKIECVWRNFSSEGVNDGK